MKSILFLVLIFFISFGTSYAQIKQSRVNIFLGAGYSLIAQNNENPIFPVGVHLAAKANFNNYDKIEPVIEFNATGFFQIRLLLFGLDGTNDDDYSYGVFSLMGGSGYKFTDKFKGQLLLGVGSNELEQKIQASFKPAIEYNNKRGSFGLQLNYTITPSSNVVKGFLGITTFFRVIK